MEQYNSIQQLLKKEGGQNKKPIFPPTVVQAVFDAKTGASLEAILAQFNSVYLQYQGSPKGTRLIIPKEMRRAGLTITYMNMEGETITERAASAVQKDNDNWGLDINWSRIDELSLSGDISVSAKGTWIINGSDTGVKAVGPKGEAGITPWLKTIDNRLHVSYDNVNWEPCSDPITPYFRWYDNKIQISYDNKTWIDLSGTFADNLYIKGYVATTSALPSGATQGDIYGVGPTYAAEDTAHTNPIYRYYVRNDGTWVDNGAFTSIAAGIVQEPGDSENAVMSQKAVTAKLSELGSKVKNVTNKIEEDEVDSIEIYDNEGNLAHSIDENGANFKNLKSNGKEVALKSDLDVSNQLNLKVSTEETKEDVEEQVWMNEDGTEEYAGIGSYGVKSSNFLDNEHRLIAPKRQWRGKIMAAYGDSITELQSNSGNPDGTTGDGWMSTISGFFDFAGRYNRGIGGSTMTLESREYRKKIYQNGSYVSRTQGDNTSSKDVDVIYAMSSWDRIKKMFPQTIKDDIALVIVMGGTNDYAGLFKPSDKPEHVYKNSAGEITISQYPEWSKNNTTDMEWMADSEYNVEQGDYDCTTYSGAVCSTILKLQRWMPKARIVFMTPPIHTTSSYNSDGTIYSDTNQGGVNRYGMREYDMAVAVKNLCGYMGIPVIDVYGECGINCFNAQLYYQDGTHPNHVNYYNGERHFKNGDSMIARAIIGKLNNIYPKSWVSYIDNGKDMSVI